MLGLLKDEPEFRERSIAYMIARNIRIEQDLVNQHRSPQRGSAPKSRDRGKDMGNQALAGLDPESGAIFVATSTSNNVALLRTLPAMPMSASERGGCSPASVLSRSLTLWSC